MSIDILNLPNLRARKTNDLGNHYRISADNLAEVQCCPHCGNEEFYKHGSQYQKYMDTPIHGKQVVIEIYRRRLLCRKCGKTSFEPLPDIDSKRLATRRLVSYIEQRCLTETFMALAREVGVDNKTIRNIFDDYVEKKREEHLFKTPEVLGIDELKIIGDYRAMLTNINHLALFDMLPSRKQVNLLNYFEVLPDKQNITTVVMDMWRTYRNVANTMLPGRLIVVDKFHVVRMANDGLERVRKRIRKGLDRSTRLKMKNERFVLLKRKVELTPEETAKTQKWFSLFPELGLAYDAKEAFFDIYDYPSRSAAESAAAKWASLLPMEIGKDFRDLTTALGNWHREIFNYYENPVTNAYTESLNGVARYINRMGRGYSFDVLRARLLYEKQAIKTGPSLHKKPRLNKSVSYANESTPIVDNLVSSAEFGAHLPTLLKLFEEGYFS